MLVMQTAIKTPSKPADTAPSFDDLMAQLQASQQAVVERDHIIEAHQQQAAKQQQQIATQQKLLKLMEEKLRLARIKRFGASSEKLAYQKGLFDEAELEEDLSDLEQQLAEEKPATKPPRKKRKGLSKKLPRVRIDLTLSEEEKAGAVKTFFTKVKEELDIIPAQARVLEYWQEKAVFEQDGEPHIISAQRPVHPLGKSIGSISLLAWIIVSKYADALPLYRLENILKRYGGNITRTTLANWIIRLDEVFMPLIKLLREHQLEGDYLQADETRLQVLKEDGKLATSDSWMWLIRGGPPGQPAVLFEYDASRGEQVPVRLLEGFAGVLQADGYAGYNKVCRDNDITRIGCWDHARRKFIEASQAAPANQHNKVSKADEALGKIRKLYAVEKRIKDLDPEEKTQQRQLLSLPILDEIKDWLQTNISRIPKDSLTWTAMRYTLNQWALLIGYCEDGRLNISNAQAENAIRPFAVGRRNWLFSDTPRGAKASATCYSLIETAKANGLEPYRYLHDVLQRIAQAETVEDLDALLPWNMK